MYRALPGPGQTEITGDEVRGHLTTLRAPAAGHRGVDPGVTDGEWTQVRPRVPWWGQTSEARQEVYAELLAAATRAVQRAHSLAPQQASASVLEGNDLSKSFKGRRVVDRVTVRVQQGEIVGLLGPNGAGKTTTFYLITGLIRPDAGRVLLDGLDLTRAPMYRARAVGNRVSGPGALDLPENDGRGKYSGYPRDPSTWAGRSGTGSSTTCWTSSRSSTSGRTRPTP